MIEQSIEKLDLSKIEISSTTKILQIEEPA
jgi:hypothetical protein